MSEAVKAALAARRAAAKLSSAKSADDDALIQPFGTPKKKGEDLTAGQTAPSIDESLASSDLWISQRAEGELLFKSCWTGRLNLSSRQPAFRTLPLSLFTLLDADAPQWYEDGSEKIGERRAWYERQDLQTLAAANGELQAVDDRLAEFASLVRLDFINLTTLNLSRNAFTSFPVCVCSLDCLIELDLSYNKLETLWTDAQVSTAREQRRDWDNENADEDGGMWSGLLARPDSPTKRQRPAAPVGPELYQPMRSLRYLRLAHNRLGNATLGLPVPEGSGTPTPYTWPPALLELDLSDNFIRGPLPLTWLGQLRDLSQLSLGGNRINDNVFDLNGDRPIQSRSPFSTPSLFPTLRALDLQRCEIDDLQHIEQMFGSNRTIFPDGRTHMLSATSIESPAPAFAVQARQLVRISSVDAAPHAEGPTRLLGLVLDGNPLRGENFKRKGGTGGIGAKISHNGSEISVQPAQLAGRSTGSADGDRPPHFSTGLRGRRGDGVNRTGLSDWDGTIP
ncbi:L domain-like protein [Microstroma glucosiphilum]|uniref:L domain-like protein n=1 Tax=Pseudomicrostroma glucosiphilum TaxID=1684307 RepID=A0A316U1B1_9BASI|nr:L domain-like protein [Pseudomicrostroma glucosiphilum]PWN19087.1 L domain-like protein [Pseudomicrostroma glucosiphilum]